MSFEQKVYKLVCDGCWSMAMVRRKFGETRTVALSYSKRISSALQRLKKKGMITSFPFEPLSPP